MAEMPMEGEASPGLDLSKLLHGFVKIERRVFSVVIWICQN